MGKWPCHWTSTGQESSIKLEIEQISPAVVELMHLQSPNGWMDRWTGRDQFIVPLTLLWKDGDNNPIFFWGNVSESALRQNVGHFIWAPMWQVCQPAELMANTRPFNINLIFLMSSQITITTPWFLFRKWGSPVLIDWALFRYWISARDSQVSLKYDHYTHHLNGRDWLDKLWDVRINKDMSG